MEPFPPNGQTVFYNAHPLSGYLQLQGNPDFTRQPVPHLALLMVRRLISNTDLESDSLLLQICSKLGKLHSNCAASSGEVCFVFLCHLVLRLFPLPPQLIEYYFLAGWNFFCCLSLVSGVFLKNSISRISHLQEMEKTFRLRFSLFSDDSSMLLD